MDDDRYRVTLPAGIIKNPQLKVASTDMEIGDVVILDGDEAVSPMYSEDSEMYGVVAAASKSGKKVLIAT